MKSRIGWLSAGKGGQPALDHFFLTLAFHDFLGLGLRAAREVSHGRQNALKLDQRRIVRTQVAFQLVEAMAQDSLVGPRVPRETGGRRNERKTPRR